MSIQESTLPPPPPPPMGDTTATNTAAAVTMNTPVEPLTPQTTLVMRTLTKGRKDLWNSHYPHAIFRHVLNPYRDFILDPLFGIGTILLPPIVVYVHDRYTTYIDHIVSHALSISIFIMKFFYRPIVIEEHMNLRSTAKQDFMINTKAAYHLPKYHPPSDIVSAFRGAIAFVLSVSADIVSLMIDNSKMMKWMETLTELKSYLDASGVSSELDESIIKPLYSGRLLDNLKILSDIQTKLYSNRHINIAQITNIDDLKDSILIGHRMMRFATSAYGTEMIRSALDREVTVHEFLGHDDNYQIHKAIAFHSGIPNVNDIRILEINDGGDMHLLRHFVAIDHISKSIVLAIRGTLSVSGALVDMTAMDGKFVIVFLLFLCCIQVLLNLLKFRMILSSSGDFCGGKAHKGMSEMATNIWLRSGDKIKAIFESDEENLKSYTFTIVGHSLGAGVACLLQIKCYKELLLGPNRVVKCYGFAPPPTFCWDSKSIIDESIQRAIDNTTCYVHDNDCVPLLSVMSIRRFSVLMDTIDNHTEHIWFYKRFQIFWEWKSIPQPLIDEITFVEKEKLSTMECCDGASKLIIPSKIIIWMKKQPSTTTASTTNNSSASSTGNYIATGCTPQSIADLNIFCWYVICDDLLITNFHAWWKFRFLPNKLMQK